MKRLFVIFGLILCLFSFSSGVVIAQETIQDKDLTISKIGILVGNKQYETAMKQCNEALKTYPEEYFLYYWRAAVYNAQGNKKLALKDYNKAISLAPDNAKLYVMRGICKYNLKDEKGALEDYNKAIELEKNNSSAYSMRAMIKLDNGDFDGADKDLEKANSLINSDNSAIKNPKNDDKE